MFSNNIIPSNCGTHLPDFPAVDVLAVEVGHIPCIKILITLSWATGHASRNGYCNANYNQQHKTSMRNLILKQLSAKQLLRVVILVRSWISEVRSIKFHITQ